MTPKTEWTLSRVPVVRLHLALPVANYSLRSAKNLSPKPHFPTATNKPAKTEKVESSHHQNSFIPKTKLCSLDLLLVDLLRADFALTSLRTARSVNKGGGHYRSVHCVFRTTTTVPWLQTNGALYSLMVEELQSICERKVWCVRGYCDPYADHETGATIPGTFTVAIRGHSFSLPTTTEEKTPEFVLRAIDDVIKLVPVAEL